MDLNDLYHRHQVALHMAERATCESEREAQRGLAEAYAAMIARARNKPRQEAVQ